MPLKPSKPGRGRLRRAISASAAGIGLALVLQGCGLAEKRVPEKPAIKRLVPKPERSVLPSAQRLKAGIAKKLSEISRLIVMDEVLRNPEKKRMAFDLVRFYTDLYVYADGFRKLKSDKGKAMVVERVRAMLGEFIDAHGMVPAAAIRFLLGKEPAQTRPSPQPRPTTKPSKNRKAPATQKRSPGKKRKNKGDKKPASPFIEVRLASN